MDLEIKVGFEIESYVLHGDVEFHMPKSCVQAFLQVAQSEHFRRVQPLCDYMVEAKTFTPDSDISNAALDVLKNLDFALAELKRISGKSDLSLCCDSRFYDRLKEHPKDNIGTHIHLDFAPVQTFLGSELGYIPSHEPVVWMMRQAIGKFAQKFCYSRRVARRLAMSVNDLPHLTLVNDARQTINYRADNTIEIAIADSTDDLGTLIDFGMDAKSCLQEAALYLSINRQPIIPAAKTRESIMRGLLREYV